MKRWRIYYANINQKKAEMAILISDKYKNISKKREMAREGYHYIGYYIMIYYYKWISPPRGQ